MFEISAQKLETHIDVSEIRVLLGHSLKEAVKQILMPSETNKYSVCVRRQFCRINIHRLMYWHGNRSEMETKEIAILMNLFM